MIPAPLVSGLANHLWPSTTVASCIGLLTLALCKNSARLRHRLWMIASVKFLIPFALLISLGSYLQPATHPSGSQPAVSAFLGQITEPFSRQRSALVIPEGVSSYAPTDIPVDVPPASKWPVALLAVWTLGFLTTVFSWLRQWNVIRAASRTAEPLGAIEDIGILSSQSLLEPGVFGIFKPVVILPESIRQRLSDQQLKAVLAHEVVHVRSHDNLSAAIHMFVEAVFWFHPLVWYIGKRLIEERELACDEAVVQAGNEPEAYAQGILNVCRTYIESPLVCVSGVTGADLKKRILRIAANQISRRLDLGRKLLLCVAGVLTLATPIALGLFHATQAHAQTAPANSAQDLSGIWQGTLHAPGGHDLRIVYKISKTDAGWSAQSYSIDQSPMPIPVTFITLQGADVKMNFANRTNISGNAGIQGNDQSPLAWGPPTLQFASGIATLTDGIPASNHTETNTESSSLIWTHNTHSITLGGDYRREQLNFLSQQNPRGTLSFTGAATGSDFTDFLAGIPDISSIAFGNADKYLRESGYDGYIADDWRVNASLTANIGLRYEYAAPITELRNRLANLDVAGNFSETAPVLAANPIGPVSGEHFSSALMHPDRAGTEPRVGIAWRPPFASSLIVRAGYGLYRNTSVYQSVATQLDQQPPFSKSFNIQNSPAQPLTLANAFSTTSLSIPNTFGIDPNFRVGYAHNWQLSLQHDLPGSLVLLATYSGIKGSRGTQEFLPNTVPLGGVNNCPLCTTGYIYLTSNGNSTREAIRIELRRRLHNGFTAQLQYTLSKSLDDDSFLGGPAPGAPTTSSAAPPNQNTIEALSASAASAPAFIAQNWLNLRSDRALSSFDQRHLLTAQLQYTSGMGANGGTLLNGWRGAMLKEWTFATHITIGSGLPLTPVTFTAVPGTGITGTVRPNYTGAPLYSAPSGLYLNPSAYTLPLPGEWGNAGRDSITGPMEFELDATLGRTFRLKDRLNLDLRFDATNALNHVTYTSWNTVLNNAQFGLPVGANVMRSVQTTLRLRF